MGAGSETMDDFGQLKKEKAKKGGAFKKGSKPRLAKKLAPTVKEVKTTLQVRHSPTPAVTVNHAESGAVPGTSTGFLAPDTSAEWAPAMKVNEAVRRVSGSAAEAGMGGGGTAAGAPSGKGRVRAKYDYDPRQFEPSVKLRCEKGDTFELLDDSNAEWWMVEDRNGETAYVPATYLELVARGRETVVMREHRLLFVPYVIAVQIIVTGLMMATTTTVVVDFAGSDSATTVSGPVISETGSTVSLSRPANYNFYVGPSVADIVKLGAYYPPCMRSDPALVAVNQAPVRALEHGGGVCATVGNPCQCNGSVIFGAGSNWNAPVLVSSDGSTVSTVCNTANFGTDPNSGTALSNECRCFHAPTGGAMAEAKDLGCCLLDGGSSAFTSSSSNCTGVGSWQGGRPCRAASCCVDPDLFPVGPDDPACAQKVSASFVDSASEDVCTATLKARPCCVGIYGECMMYSADQCDFFNGIYHAEKNLCSEVSCTEASCGLSEFANSDQPDQFYRLITSIFLHNGALQLTLVLMAQMSLMVDLERVIGWWRLAVIYLASGAGGNMLGGIIAPYQVSVGPVPALYGLAACLLVELQHGWDKAEKPKSVLCKYVFQIVVSFGLGLLPYQSNFANFGGVGIGLILGFVLLPWQAHSRAERAKHSATQVMAFMGTFAAFLILLTVQFGASDTECVGCTIFDCVDFVSDFCSIYGQRNPLL